MTIYPRPTANLPHALPWLRQLCATILTATLRVYLTGPTLFPQAPVFKAHPATHQSTSELLPRKWEAHEHIEKDHQNNMFNTTFLSYKPQQVIDINQLHDTKLAPEVVSSSAQSRHESTPVVGR
jgi:hypothetical protein